MGPRILMKKPSAKTLGSVHGEGGDCRRIPRLFATSDGLVACTVGYHRVAQLGKANWSQDLPSSQLESPGGDDFSVKSMKSIEISRCSSCSSHPK